MTAAIPGHGYREQVTPSCKCGWRGFPTFGPNTALEQYEQHKASIRHNLGLALPRHPEAPPRPRRPREIAVDGPRPALTILKGGQ